MGILVLSIIFLYYLLYDPEGSGGVYRTVQRRTPDDLLFVLIHPHTQTLFANHEGMRRGGELMRASFCARMPLTGSAQGGSQSCPDSGTTERTSLSLDLPAPQPPSPGARDEPLFPPGSLLAPGTPRG